MKRYFTRASLWTAPIEEEAKDATARPAPTCYEPDAAPRNTGLLDASGAPIYASDERKVGFL